LERGVNESPRIDDELKKDEEPLVRSVKESRVEESREQEGGTEDDPGGSGHRIAGSGSSVESYNYTDHGEEGGSSHPKPKDPEERTDRLP
jgi:hypothetical protein